MNRNELKNCFDTLTPTDAQKEKMLLNILKAHKAPMSGFIKFCRYGMAFAAVLAVAILTVTYSNMGFDGVKQQNNYAANYQQDSQTEIADGNAADEVQSKPQEENAPTKKADAPKSGGQRKPRAERKVAKADTAAPETTQSAVNEISGGASAEAEGIPSKARIITPEDAQMPAEALAGVPMTARMMLPEDMMIPAADPEAEQTEEENPDGDNSEETEEATEETAEGITEEIENTEETISEEIE